MSEVKVKTQPGFEKSDEQFNFIVDALKSDEMKKKSLSEVEDWLMEQGGELFRRVAAEYMKKREQSEKP